MFLTETKVFIDDNKAIQRVIVKRYSSYHKKEMDIVIKKGSKLIVNPMNKQKKKHRDRLVEVKSFTEDDIRGIRAVVTFLDTNRRGMIPVTELDYNHE